MAMKTNLKELRLLTGMTANEFAERIGVNRYTYRNWEQGTRDFDIAMAVELADLFGVSVDQLLGRKPIPSILITPRKRNRRSN